MTKYYSPNTLEHINTTDPAPWMGVADTPAPDYDPETQGCFYRDNQWVVEDVTHATPTPEEIDALRRASYTTEADPLYFKAMRQEIDMQEWHDKVAEIRTRYPKETE